METSLVPSMPISLSKADGKANFLSRGGGMIARRLTQAKTRSQSKSNRETTYQINFRQLFFFFGLQPFFDDNGNQPALKGRCGKWGLGGALEKRTNGEADH